MSLSFATMSSPPRSICLLRLSAIGDVTHVVPVVLALREAWPTTRLTWIIGKLEHKLLAGMPGVEFIVFDKGAPGALRKLRAATAGRRFDALLQLQLSFRANRIAWSLRAERRVGYDRRRSKELHGWRLTDRIRHQGDQHVRDALASFLEPLGLPPAPPRWSIPVAPDDLAFAAEHVDPDRPTLVVTPCSSHARRNWLPERYAAVIDHASACDWQVIVSAGPSPSERTFVDDILAETKAPVRDLTGRDTLKKLAGLLGAADLVLAPDTGPAHLANAMGTPVLGLYAATDPGRSGPYDSRALCVDRYADAARQFLRREPEALRWGTKIEHDGVMALIQVDEVIDRFEAWRSEQG